MYLCYRGQNTWVKVMDITRKNFSCAIQVVRRYSVAKLIHQEQHVTQFLKSGMLPRKFTGYFLPMRAFTTLKTEDL